MWTSSVVVDRYSRTVSFSSWSSMSDGMRSWEPGGKTPIKSRMLIPRLVIGMVSHSGHVVAQPATARIVAHNRAQIIDIRSCGRAVDRVGRELLADTADSAAPFGEREARKRRAGRLTNSIRLLTSRRRLLR